MAPRKTAKSSSKSKGKALRRADGVTWLTAAEYARRVGITKPRMSDYFARGLPFEDGKDEEGRRDSKLVNIDEADAWRLANTEARVGSDGTIRGLSLAGGAEPHASLSHAGSDRGEGVPPIAPAAAEPDPPPGPPPTPHAQRSPPANRTPASQTASVTASAAARIAEAKAIEAEMAAESRALNLAKAQGALVDRAAAMDIISGFAKGAAAILERKPGERAAHVAAELGCTPHEAMLALRKVTDELHAELAKLAGSIGARMEGLGS